MTVPTNHGRAVWLYCAIAFGFSWLFWIPTALAARGFALPSALAEFLNSPFNPAAFGPLVAALALTLRQAGGRGILQLLRRAVAWRFPKQWWAAIVLLPLIVFGGAVLTAVGLGVRSADFSVLSNPPFALIAFFVILFTSGPLQEEFGWRGYALPHLQARYGALASGALVGVIWHLWHLPLVMIPGRFMAADWPTFLALLPVIVLASVLFAWVAVNTGGSILAAIVFHTAMNWSIWSTMPAMQMDVTTAVVMTAFLAVAVLIVVRRWGPSLAGRGG